MVKYIENYALYEEIGAGVYGKVYRAINNNDKKQYAVKVIPITKFRENKKLEECTVNEINILTNIENNPHIIRYYDMLKTSNNFYFIYEFCNGGTLDGLIAKEGRLSEEQALLIFKQLIDAFKILNKYNIMHRDMKPDNIFFHNGIIKLGDFGFCKNLSSADDMTRTMLGSPIYMAPEVLRGEIYSNKADIWSLGVVLYEMLFGTCPFMSNSIAKLIEVLNTKQLEFPEEISPFLKSLISRMLTKDPIQRCSWMEIFTVSIDSNGRIESGQKTNKIMSLEDAKPSNEGIFTNSNKIIPKEAAKADNSQQNGSNFKKSKSKNVSNGNASTTTNYTSDSQNTEKMFLAREHKQIVEGGKLAMQIMQSKVPNYTGYGYLLLSRVHKVIGDIQPKLTNADLKSMLDREARDVKSEMEEISSKMFSYQQKGLEDWKKYLRGKFFEEEKTIAMWYRMVLYLNGSANLQAGVNPKAMVETIKSILY